MTTKKTQLELMTVETSENTENKGIKPMIDLTNSLKKIETSYSNTDKVHTFMLSDYLVKYPIGELPDNFVDIPLSMSILLQDEGKIIKSIGVYLDRKISYPIVCNAYGISIKSANILDLHIATTNQLQSYANCEISGLTFKLPIYHKKININELFPDTDDSADFITLNKDFTEFDFISGNKPIAVYPFQLPENVEFSIVTNYKENFEFYFLVTGTSEKGQKINMVIRPDRELLRNYLDEKKDRFTINSKYTEKRKKGTDKEMSLTLCNYSFK